MLHGTLISGARLGIEGTTRMGRRQGEDGTSILLKAEALGPIGLTADPYRIARRSIAAVRTQLREGGYCQDPGLPSAKRSSGPLVVSPDRRSLSKPEVAADPASE